METCGSRGTGRGYILGIKCYVLVESKESSRKIQTAMLVGFTYTRRASIEPDPFLHSLLTTVKRYQAAVLTVAALGFQRAICLPVLKCLIPNTPAHIGKTYPNYQDGSSY